jgi:hypothetical protein
MPCKLVKKSVNGPRRTLFLCDDVTKGCFTAKIETEYFPHCVISFAMSNPQKSGIGTRCLPVVEGYLKKNLKCNSIGIFSIPSAIGFWKKQGYKKEEGTHAYEGYMTKELK